MCVCVFGENSSCQKFCVVPLVESIANCCFDSWITHKKKRERANCIDQGNLARYAFCIPLAKNSLWASRSIFQICSFTSFYSSAIRSTRLAILRHERNELNGTFSKSKSIWVPLCDYTILWRGNFSCLESKKDGEALEFSMRRHVKTIFATTFMGVSVEFPPLLK